MANTSTPTIITQKKSKPMTMGELKTAVMERHGIQNPTSLEGSTREQLMKALTKPPIVKKFIGGAIKAATKAATKAKRNIKKKVDKALYSSSDTGPKAPGVTAGGRTSKSAVIGQRRVADYTKGRRIEGAKAGVGVGAGGVALVNSGYDSVSGNIPIENFKNRKQMERGSMKPTLEKVKETSRDKKRKTTSKKAGGKVKGYKKGGPITYRMSGGQVTGNSYD
jgi:hypothetical protein